MSQEQPARSKWRRVLMALLVALGPLLIGSIILMSLYSSAAKSAELPGTSIQSAESRF